MSPHLRLTLVAAHFILLAGMGLTPRAAGQWSAIGSPQRPNWVSASSERRLRLLESLPPIKNNLQKKAEGYIGSKGPGLAVGLVLDDGLYYSEGFGFADAARTRKPDENTIFRAGSLSKVITGTGLLTLIDDPARQMSLNDLADKPGFLPELKFVCPTFNKDCNRGSQNLGIRLSHLVSHTSGLPNVMEQTNASVPVWTADLKKAWLIFAPGTYGAYSGVGVEGVGLIEQRVSGLLFVEFIRKELFAPLGMQNSSMDERTLPQQSRAQKWLLNIGDAPNKCIEACNVDEGKCMAGAHSTDQRKQCVHEKQMCQNDCPKLGTTWWFTQWDQIIAGDDQPMILPAGGLATTVADLGKFLQMWLSGQAPKVNGRPLLKQATINAASNSMFSSKGLPPSTLACSAAGMSDKNAPPFAYSKCGMAYGFGVTWYAGDVPYIEHNGDEPGLSGSNTRVDQPAKMAATGLISTEPYPQAKKPVPQPADLDGSFINDIVYPLLSEGENADKATNWDGQALATGVARVLFLSGKTPVPGDLGMFTPGFVGQRKLTQGNIVAALKGWQQNASKCSSFRVRGVESATRIAAAFRCGNSEWFTALEVESASPHRIAFVAGLGSTKSDKEKCLEACSVDEGGCMQKAHSSDQRKACVGEKKACDAECK